MKEEIKNLTDKELKTKLDSFVDESGAFVLSSESFVYAQENARRMGIYERGN